MPRHYRKVIKITALDSPNVRRELARQRGDPEESWPPETPGVLSWGEYQKRLATWDEVRKCVGLAGEFYEGAELLLYPPAWLNHAARLAEGLRGRPRRAEGVGVDAGEGVADTAEAAVDRLGLIELSSRPTPDTSVIAGEVLAFARRHGAEPSQALFDAGGGGLQIADEMRSRGHRVRTVGFGEAATPPPRLGRKTQDAAQGDREDRYAYLNRRAQMYWELRLLLDPASGGFAIPAEYAELRRQMSAVPLLYDREGRIRMLPKNKRDPKSNEQTLTQLLGRSPDEMDALVLAVHAMLHPQSAARAGAW